MALLKFQSLCYLSPMVHSIFQRKLFLNFSQSSSCHWYSYFSKQALTLPSLSLLQKKGKDIFSVRFFTHFPPLLRKVYTQDQNKKGRSHSSEPSTEIDDADDDIDEVELNSILYKTSESLWNISSVAVLQPWIKWGPQKRWETTPDILLNEACSLVHSLPFMHVSYKEHIGLQSIRKKYIFGSGNLLKLKRIILENQCQGVFISLNHLSTVQKRSLEEHFGVPVFDRFFIVLAIFKHHASTLEARLQIALAEMPMLSKYRLQDKEKLLFDQKALKLKKAMVLLETKRKVLRKSREKSSIPTVAVLGYTNCGKTTLIRALTGDQRAQGEDRLFATLDVTVHKGILPCSQSILLMDSVGFIQDIPTSLVASFKATFQDIVNSDVVIIVRDMSHPDHVGQMKTVRKTLRSLPLPEETTVIVVNNKSDLIPEDADIHDSFLQEGIMASAITGQGLNEVVANIESEVLRVTGRKMYVMRLLTGSSKIEWLKENAAVTFEEVDEKDSQYTIVKVFLSDLQKITFKKAFQL